MSDNSENGLVLESGSSSAGYVTEKRDLYIMFQVHRIGWFNGTVILMFL